MKSRRQNVILSIIESRDVETQEELIDALRSEGFNVTQATVSRDIRELKLTKVTAENGKYKYVLPGVKKAMARSHVYSTISASVISVECAMNTVVIKTYPGMAPAVATGIDSHAIEGVVGCIAGDDTIFVAVDSIENANNARREIRKLIEA
ncbi:MAG: arginine repressor [Ruminococcaceae bacterium]|nr:arginine repressor [Oscillospiraceae bacterium]